MITVSATKLMEHPSHLMHQISDTPVEVEYYRNGGILHTVLAQMASTN